jgi:hypothetical protein
MIVRQSHGSADLLHVTWRSSLIAASTNRDHPVGIIRIITWRTDR